jgi:hypothetical protein
MAGPRKSPMNPFLYKLLAADGYAVSDNNANLKAAADAAGISHAGLITTAEITGGSHRQLSFHLQAAQAFGVPFELWVKGLLDQLDDTEEAELARILRKKTLASKSKKAS